MARCTKNPPGAVTCTHQKVCHFEFTAHFLNIFGNFHKLYFNKLLQQILSEQTFMCFSKQVIQTNIKFEEIS